MYSNRQSIWLFKTIFNLLQGYPVHKHTHVVLEHIHTCARDEFYLTYKEKIAWVYCQIRI